MHWILPFRDLAVRYKAHHILLWAVYYAFWVLMYRQMYPSIIPLLWITGFYMVSHALGYYVLVFYPYPKYLLKGKIWAFLGSFMLVIILATGLLGTALMLYSKDWEGTFFTDYGTIYTISFFSNGTTIGILLAIKMFVDKMRSQRQQDQTRKKHLESELEYLKAQINPHFLFNAINSVYVLIKRDPDLAADTLIKLSDLLRFQLYECSGDKIAIEKELEYLRNFVELEKMRKGERVQVTWEQEGDLRGFSIAPLLLIPFVENAFKYVSNHSHEANVVHIRLKRTDAHFEVWLSNSTEPLMSGEPGGIGIQNVRRRLELIYPGRHFLEIRSQPHEFSVTLRLTIDE